MKDHRLHEGLEMLPNQTIPILHHVGGAYCRNLQAVCVRALQANSKDILLVRIPIGMQTIPHVLHDTKQNGM